VNLLDQAYSLDPDPVYLLNAARVLELKDDLHAARQRYERFLQVEKDPKLLRLARERLEGVLDRLPGTLVIEVSPPAARAAVDGHVVEPGTPIELRRGSHSVEVTLVGHETSTRIVDVSPGVETRVRMELKPLHVPRAVNPPPAPAAAPSTVEARRPEPGESHVGETPAPRPAPGSTDAIAIQAESRYSPWQWVLIGTGTVAIALGGVLTYLAKAQNDEVASAATFPDGTVRLDAMSRQDAVSRHASAQQKMNGAIALYAIGGTAFATGVVLAILDIRKGHAPTPVAVSLTPCEEGAFVGATGRF